jgi:hypothetical protein
MMDPQVIFRKQAAQVEETICRDGYLIPCFLIITDEFDIISLVPIKLTAETKPNIWESLKNGCVAFKATMLIHVSEAWGRSGNSVAEALALPPSKSDQRIELALVICAFRDSVTDERTAICSAREIIRNTNGGVSGLGPEIAGAEGQELAGSLMTLLSDVPPQRAERRRARAEFERTFHRLWAPKS